MASVRSGRPPLRDTPALLYFSFGVTSFGRLLVAITAKGVCAALLGDRDEVLREELAERFPGTSCIEDSQRLGPTLTALLAWVECPSAVPPVTLDLYGTLFQKQVWAALLLIPPGTTLTYTDLAALLGMSGSVRAVAGAVAANPAALLVPCHRVLAKGGSLTGCRWGLARKRVLLEREAQATPFVLRP